MARDDPMRGRGEAGRFTSIVPALERFRAKCRFEPATGCVIWTGGTTAGRGNTARYGSFKYEGRRWFAHRWAAEHVHGLDVAGVTVGHCCPHGPNTLCVQHLRPETLGENVAERNRRVAQSPDVRQHWLFVSLGLRALEPVAELADLVPFYEPPAWLTVDKAVNLSDEDCPF